MRVVEEIRRDKEISIAKSRAMDAVNERLTHIDPKSRLLPLDDCGQDDY